MGGGLTATSTRELGPAAVESLGSNPFGSLVDSITSAGGFGGFLAVWGVFGFLETIWFVYAILAYLVAIIMLALYVYASTRLAQLEALHAQQIADEARRWDAKYRGGTSNSRVQNMLAHIDSPRPNDWKLAIIEADVLLDEILIDRGFAGTSLGERLKSISPTQLQSLDDAWAAHRVRNQIAHQGPDFILTRRLAEDTIKQYRRVFAEFGVH